jgi:hypothetical protein
MDIFVFGSNLAGRHGLGGALHAKQQHGAIYGQGIGLQGRSYAIPTKDHDIKTLSLNQITYYINDFITFARANDELNFNVTRIGCGLAGYNWIKDILPIFNSQKLPSNINFI